MSNLTHIEKQLQQAQKEDWFTILLNCVEIRLRTNLTNYGEEMKYSKNNILNHKTSIEISKELTK